MGELLSKLLDLEDDDVSTTSAGSGSGSGTTSPGSGTTSGSGSGTTSPGSGTTSPGSGTLIEKEIKNTLTEDNLILTAHRTDSRYIGDPMVGRKSKDAAFLDRHKLQCPDGQVLNSFKLETGPPLGPNDPVAWMKYRYKCVGTDNPDLLRNKQPMETKNTLLKTFKYLDRQKPNCGDKFLDGFQLQRKEGQNFNYKTNCVSNDGRKMNIEQQENKWTDRGKEETVYLDRQEVKCPNDQGITYFNLENKNNTTRYVYGCAKIIPNS